MKNILENINVNSCATGFIKNKSILDNVNPHLNKACILKMDIKDFFPSISFKRVISIFLNCDYHRNIAYSLSRLCLLDNSLPQGASTSPYLANIICKRIDTRLYHLSNKFGYSFTRYADDIAISGNEIPWKFKDYVEKILNEEGFYVNSSKTKLLNRNAKKIITGVSVTSDKPMLPREQKRKLRYQAHKLLNTSIPMYKDEVFLRDPVYIERLIGKYNYWKFIEPSNDYVIKTIKMLYEYSKELSKT